MRFAGTALVTIFVDDAHFDQLHFEVEPQASLRILSRTMLFDRAKVSQSVSQSYSHAASLVHRK